MAPLKLYERIIAEYDEAAPDTEQEFTKLLDFLADPPIENWSYGRIKEDGKLKEVLEWTLKPPLKKVALHFIMTNELRVRFTQELTARCALPSGGCIAYNGKETLVWFRTL